MSQSKTRQEVNTILEETGSKQKRDLQNSLGASQDDMFKSLKLEIKQIKEMQTTKDTQMLTSM